MENTTISFNKIGIVSEILENWDGPESRKFAI